MTVFNFTRARIDDLPLPTNRAQDYHYDTAVPGLGLCIGAGGTKTYFAEKRLKGKTRRVTIGKHGAWVPDTARERARELIVNIDRGIDPNAVKAEEKAKTTALATVFGQFIEARNLRTKTISIYTDALQRCFPDWLDKPITDISKDMIEQRYRKLLNKTWQRGTSGIAQAHQAMRTLRAVLNYAGAVYEDSSGRSLLPENPVKRLTQAGMWQDVPSRESIIQPTQLKDWYEAVMKLDNDIVRDYLLLCLFTGLRRNEATRLKWSDIDFEAKTLRIRAEHSKNHLEHRLPLSTFLVALLDQRSKIRDIRNDHVFPGSGAKSGHLVEFRNDIAKVTKQSGVKFMTHDMRRTFLTIAEMLDIPHYALQKLANHKTTDITGRYIQSDVERLREPMQQITNYIMQKAGIKLTDIRTKAKVKVLALA